MIVTLSDSPTSLDFAAVRIGWNRFTPSAMRSMIFAGILAMTDRGYFEPVRALINKGSQKDTSRSAYRTESCQIPNCTRQITRVLTPSK